MKPTELIPDSEVQTSLDTTIEAIQTIVDAGSTSIPTLLAIFSRKSPTADLEATVMRVPKMEEDDEARHKRFFLVGLKAAQISQPDSQVVMASLVSESWMLKLDKDEPLITRPSKNKDRVEVLSVALQTFDGRSAGVIFEMRRKADNTLVLVGKDEYKMPVGRPGEGGLTLRCALLDSLFMGIHTMKR